MRRSGNETSGDVERSADRDADPARRWGYRANRLDRPHHEGFAVFRERRTAPAGEDRSIGQTAHHARRRTADVDPGDRRDRIAEELHVSHRATRFALEVRGLWFYRGLTYD